MSKMTKNEFDFCKKFVDELIKYCEIEKNYYTNISQNDDHSEDFVNRMTDMASSYRDVCKFVVIVSDKLLDSLLLDIPVGDTNEKLGQQVEQQQKEPAEILKQQ